MAEGLVVNKDSIEKTLTEKMKFIREIDKDVSEGGRYQQALDLLSELDGEFAKQLIEEIKAERDAVKNLVSVFDAFAEYARNITNDYEIIDLAYKYSKIVS